MFLSEREKTICPRQKLAETNLRLILAARGLLKNHSLVLLLIIFSILIPTLQYVSFISAPNTKKKKVDQEYIFFSVEAYRYWLFMLATISTHTSLFVPTLLPFGSHDC